MRVRLVLLLSLLTSCVAVDPPLPDRESYAEMPELPKPSFWPARRMSDLATLASQFPRELPVVHPAADGSVATPSERNRVARVERVGRGLVLSLRPIDEQGVLLAPDAAPVMSFVSFPPSRESIASAIDSVSTSAAPGARFDWTDGEGEARGVVIEVGGRSSAARRCASSLRAELVERGYSVLRTEVDRVPSRPIELTATNSEEVSKAAKLLAERVNDEVVETVYGVEAMLAVQLGRFPALKDAKIVLLGVDDGVAILPALALRLRGKIHGAVLVGGGADLAKVDAALPKEERRIHLAFTGDVDLDRSERWFYDVYSRDARLDPVATSIWLKDVRTCIVDFEDHPEGDVLFERLSHPLRFHMGDSTTEMLTSAALRSERILEFLWSEEAYHDP